MALARRPLSGPPGPEFRLARRSWAARWSWTAPGAPHTGLGPRPEQLAPSESSAATRAPGSHPAQSPFTKPYAIGYVMDIYIYICDIDYISYNILQANAYIYMIYIA